jgi:hypothetical protein
VEGRVGLSDQAFCVGRSRPTECYAYASRPGDVMTADLDRSCNQLQQTVGESENVVIVGGGAKDEDELVARETGNEIAGSHGVAQTFADGHEQAVARAVAKEIVHRFEPVEVQKEQGGRLARIFDQSQFDLVQERSSVG